MTRSDLGVALVLFIATAAFSVYSWYVWIRVEKRKAQRYPLFAIRDQLICLVATGEIQEDDPVFAFMYEGVNRLIPEIKPVSLSAVVQALRSSTFVEGTFLEHFIQAVNHKNPEVRATARKLFSTLDHILLAQSLFVWVSTQLGHPGKNLPNWLQRIVSTVLSTQYNALMLYIKVQDTGSRLAARA